MSAERCALRHDSGSVNGAGLEEWLGIDLAALTVQAAHMTGGLQIQVRRPCALLQCLTMFFAGDLEVRELLELPQGRSVDFKASCFCHAKVIDVGYICSVCLSVFCSKQAACMTCGTEFKKRS
jgi:transcription initiation factor TFIIH subunit 3